MSPLYANPTKGYNFLYLHDKNYISIEVKTLSSLLYCTIVFVYNCFESINEDSFYEFRFVLYCVEETVCL